MLALNIKHKFLLNNRMIFGAPIILTSNVYNSLIKLTPLANRRNSFVNGTHFIIQLKKNNKCFQNDSTKYCSPLPKT